MATALLGHLTNVLRGHELWRSVRSRTLAVEAARSFLDRQRADAELAVRNVREATDRGRLMVESRGNGSDAVEVIFVRDDLEWQTTVELKSRRELMGPPTPPVKP